MKISQISSNNSPHACIVSKGLGSIGNPHDTLTQTLVDCGMEVHLFDREGDLLLSKSPSAINEYIKFLANYVNKLIEYGKSVELFGVSFGGYLALELAKEIKEKINSVVAVATLLNPYDIISARATPNPKNDAILDILTSTGMTTPVLKEVVESLKGQGIKEVTQSGLIILGNGDKGIGDGFETIENLNGVKGDKLIKIVLEGAVHTNTLSHPDTLKEVKNFYGKKIKNL